MSLNYEKLNKKRTISDAFLFSNNFWTVLPNFYSVLRSFIHFVSRFDVECFDE